jgi:phosphate transport system substrate-binding protein
MIATLAGSVAVAARPLRGTPWLTGDGKIRIVGYYDMEEMLMPLCQEFGARHGGLEFSLELLGTKAAPEALARGVSLLAPMGAEMLPEQLMLYRKLRGSEPLMIRVAHDSLNPKARSSPTAVYVHRDNPLATISLDTLRKVFSAGPAQLTRWGELGMTGTWEQAAIRPHSLAESTVIGRLLRLQEFGNDPAAPQVVGYPQSRDVVAALAREALGLGFANLNHVTPAVRAVAVSERAGGTAYAGTAENLRAGLYPLDRCLLVYLARDARGRLEPLARDLTRLLLSPLGQRTIAAGSLGYLALSEDDVVRERNKLS